MSHRKALDDRRIGSEIAVLSIGDLQLAAT